MNFDKPFTFEKQTGRWNLELQKAAKDVFSQAGLKITIDSGIPTGDTAPIYQTKEPSGLKGASIEIRAFDNLAGWVSVISVDLQSFLEKLIEIMPADKIKYEKHTKQEYINRLRGIFARNSYIKVSFDEIKVMMHPVNENYYGVTLHQGYKSSTYSDDGYLFLLWDFTDEQAPQIHVRTWQPDMLNGSRLPEDEIFSLADFDI